MCIQAEGCTAEMNAFTQSLSKESVYSGEMNRLKGCTTEMLSLIHI